MTRWWSIAAAVILLAGCNQNRTRTGEEGEQAGRDATSGEQRGTTGGTGSQQQGQPSTLTGTVASVSEDTLELRTQSMGSVELDVSDDAQFTSSGRPVDREQIQEGMPVRATYTQEGDSRKLIRLEVMGGSPGMQPGPSGGQQGTDVQPGEQRGAPGTNPSY